MLPCIALATKIAQSNLCDAFGTLMTTASALDEYLREHLPYEFGMMQQTYWRLLQEDDHPVVRNALFESFCTHARNLKDFVTNDAGKGNNSVTARGFVATFGERVPPSLTGAFQRLNQQMAHLATRRSKTNKFTISDAENVLLWLKPTMCKFIASLPPTQRAKWNVCQHTCQPTSTNQIQTLTSRIVD